MSLGTTVGFVAAALIIGGVIWLAYWGQRSGERKQELKDAKADRDAALEAKRIAEGVDAMPDGAALAELRRRRGLLPPG